MIKIITSNLTTTGVCIFIMVWRKMNTTESLTRCITRESESRKKTETAVISDKKKMMKNIKRVNMILILIFKPVNSSNIKELIGH